MKKPNQKIKQDQIPWTVPIKQYRFRLTKIYKKGCSLRKGSIIVKVLVMYSKGNSLNIWKVLGRIFMVEYLELVLIKHYKFRLSTENMSGTEKK